MKKPKQCESCAKCAPIFLRVMVGLLFVIPGLMKLQSLITTGDHMVSGMLGGAIWLAWILALIEVIAGGMVLFGYKQCAASIPLAIILIVALVITTVKFGFDPSSALWHLLGIAALFQVHVACPEWTKKK